MKDLLIGQLRQGNTGSEILSILDTLVSNIEDENIQDCAEYFESIQPTLEEIAF